MRTDLNGIYMKWEDPSYYGMNMRGKEHPEHRCIRVLRTNRQLYFIEEERRKCIPSEIWKMQGLIGRYQHDQVPAVFVAGISENGVLERTLTEIAGKGIKTFYFVDGIAGVQC